MKRAYEVAVLATCLAWAGCGTPEDRAPEGGSVGAPLTAEEFAAELDEELAESYCRVVFECPGQTAPGEVVLLRRYESERDCVEGVLSDFGLDPTAELLASVDAGRVGYDDAQGGACLAAYDALLGSLRCGLAAPSVGELEECRGVFTGEVEAGGACGGDIDCVEGALCAGSVTTCYGACAVDDGGRGEPGREPCGEVVCEVGAFCQPQPDGGQRCEPKKGLGEACRYTDDCTLERLDAGCLPDGPASALGTCAAYGSLGAGQDCNGEDLWCEEGLECSPDTDECAPGAELSLGEGGEECDDSGKLCGTGLACVYTIGLEGVSRSCEPTRKAGEACVVPTECAPGLTCLDVDLEVMPPEIGACGAPRGAGEACAGDGECASGSCGEGQCASAEVCEVP